LANEVALTRELPSQPCKQETPRVRLVAEPLFSDRGPQDYDASSVAGSGVEAVSGTLGHSIPFALVPRLPEHPGYVPLIVFPRIYIT